MGNITIIINDAPYGTEKAWNALRLTQMLLVTSKETKINIFLMGDSVAMAKTAQSVPQGYYNLEQMLVDCVSKDVKVRACGTCCKSRGLKQQELISGVEVGKMVELARWVSESAKVLTF
jgi:uncharacterized protein involved in oxidation of intracellular sulfur